MDTPWKVNGWNLQITSFEKENHLNQTFIFGNRFNFQKSICLDARKVRRELDSSGMKSWVCRNFFWQNDGISISLAVSTRPTNMPRKRHPWKLHPRN